MTQPIPPAADAPPGRRTLGLEVTAYRAGVRQAVGQHSLDLPVLGEFWLSLNDLVSPQNWHRVGLLAPDDDAAPGWMSGRARYEINGIAAGRTRVLVDGEVYSDVSAEQAYLIAKYGAFDTAGAPAFSDTLVLTEAAVVTIQYSHPVTP